MVAADRRRARTMPLRSPLTSVTPALSHGHVGAGAHGDADIGGGQRRRVVDAVAGHGDHAALAAQPLDDRALVLGQHLGLDLGDAEPARHGAARWWRCRRSA